MPFVKLDCGILDSTLWYERTARELFITALLMAEPFETPTAMPQIEIGSLKYTGWSVPPGWYGLVKAASIGIVRRAGLAENDTTLVALDRLGQPELGSRSQAFDGRRLVRVDGGFIVLNFIKYRENDATTASRSRRWRERQKQKLESRPTHCVSVTPRRVATENDTIAEAEAEAEETCPRSRAPVSSRARALKADAAKTDDDALNVRAAHLRQVLYPGWYAQYRNGARLRLIANTLDFQDAVSLVRVWDDARLEKLAKIVLTTDDPFIANTDRGFKIFALKSSWADDRLAEWELEHGPAV